MNIQFLSDEILDRFLRIPSPSLIINVLPRHHSMFRNRIRNPRRCHRTLIIRQNLIHLFIFPIRTRLFIPRKQIAQFPIIVIFGSIHEMMGCSVQRVTVSKRRDGDVSVFDSVHAVEIEIKCDVCFDGVDSGFLFLVDELLRQSDAVERSQVEEGDWMLASDMGGGKDCIHVD
jgi:hypothetical protein